MPGPMSPSAFTPRPWDLSSSCFFTDEETEEQAKAEKAEWPAAKSRALDVLFPASRPASTRIPHPMLVSVKAVHGLAACRGCGLSCHEDGRQGRAARREERRADVWTNMAHVSTKQALEFKTLRQRWLAGRLAGVSGHPLCRCAFPGAHKGRSCVPELPPPAPPLQQANGCAPNRHSASQKMPRRRQGACQPSV